MQRDNTAAEKLVEQALKNIEQAQDHNQEKLELANESDLDTDEQLLVRHLHGKDVGLAEEK
jgi:hypothetical protein